MSERRCAPTQNLFTLLYLFCRRRLDQPIPVVGLFCGQCTPFRIVPGDMVSLLNASCCPRSRALYNSFSNCSLTVRCLVGPVSSIYSLEASHACYVSPFSWVNEVSFTPFCPSKSTSIYGFLALDLDLVIVGGRGTGSNESPANAQHDPCVQFLRHIFTKSFCAVPFHPNYLIIPVF